MYRKKTVLLCSLHNPTLKPVGIVVFVSDERKTVVRVSAKGVNNQKCYLFVDTDGVCDSLGFYSAKGGEICIAPTLLEKATCVLLDENLSPLCFGSSAGRIMTTECVKKAKESIKDKFFEKQPQKTKETKLAKTVETKSSAVQDEYCKKSEEKSEEKNIAQNTDVTQEEMDMQKNPFQSSVESFDGNYERFVVATDNYYEGKQFDCEQLSLQKAKVCLAEYAKALDDFYKSGAKEGYLAKVGGELEKVFESYSPYPPLMQKISDSFFVKITGEGENFFALGLLQEEGKPTYICYALPKTIQEETGFLTICVGEGEEKKEFCLIMQSASDGKVFKALA